MDNFIKFMKFMAKKWQKSIIDRRKRFRYHENVL